MTYALEETRHTVWSEVSNVLKILDFPFEKRLIDHLSSLQKSTDLILMESLLEVYEDNQPLVKVLSDLSDWDPQIDPLADFAIYYDWLSELTSFIQASCDKYSAKISAVQDLNLRPSDLQSLALPT